MTVRDRIVPGLIGGPGPLALLVAPAGYGKTTVLTQAAAAFEGKVLHWHPSRDTRGAPVLLGRLGRRLHIPPAAGPAEQDGGVTVEAVLLAVERHADPVLLLVDDVHLVHGSPAEQVLEELALLAPANLRLVLAGRRMPALNLARAELADTCVLTARELRLGEAEIARAFPDAGPDLAELTGGWPAVLRLSAPLVLAGRDPLDSGALRTYLDREVLGALPPGCAPTGPEAAEEYGMVDVPLLRAHTARRRNPAAHRAPAPAADGPDGAGRGAADGPAGGYGPGGGRRPEGEHGAGAGVRAGAGFGFGAGVEVGSGGGSPAGGGAGAGVVPAWGPLSVRCFRRYEATVGGQALDWSATRPRVRTLARLLSVHAGRPVHREELMAALWPESPARTAGRGLQVAVSALRTFLEPGTDRGRAQVLVRQGEAYMLVLAPDGSSDVQRFEAALAEGLRAAACSDADRAGTALQQALAVYTGELLPEDGPAEWVVPIRERYRAQAVRAAHVLAEVELGRDRAAAAVTAASYALSVDPFQDAVWRLLIAAHLRAGDPVAARHAERRHARILATLSAPDPA
ncbi:BTAD domain-containing putative transcriptional regulator [Streptomyces sp. NRRL S-87]|uniref:BTAD domain-containing putative transcriptional regulator n=1 Tax=Streptomyces sp. NRRL S-87 TaxID=1463920 RepID=UPI0004C24785|nr:BTAD domain-containing putative transcriptional regulator [Streptomyces sp. NRRL S-87]